MWLWKSHKCWQGSQLVGLIYSAIDMHSILQPSSSKRCNSQMSGWISCSFRRSSGITPNHKVILLLPQQHLCWDQITLPFCGEMIMGKEGECKLLHSVWTIWCCNNYISTNSVYRIKKNLNVLIYKDTSSITDTRTSSLLHQVQIHTHKSFCTGPSQWFPSTDKVKICWTSNNHF